MDPSFDQFSAIDFLTCDAFVAHQLSPDEHSTQLWDTWLAGNPANRSDWEEAVYLLDSIRTGLGQYAATVLPEDTINSLLRRIRESNSAGDVPVRRLNRYNWVAAASVIVLCGLFAWVWLRSRDSKNYYAARISELENTYIEKVNSGSKNETIFLPDSSVVELHPGSRLAYRELFGAATRDVYLSGEATFEVTKNASRPFRVYANEVVTRVLGTRFKVRAFDDEKDVLVNVASGQVSVFRETGSGKASAANVPANNGLLLLPNQMAVFSRQSEEFNKTLVEKPEILAQALNAPGFEYDAVPVSRVFEDLETSYGISIRYNREQLKDCELSASLKNETFEEKLQVICTTINAEYQKFDGQILINGGGCH